MMKPTDEQLRDPKWWKLNAPKDATHYDSGDDSTPWIKKVGGNWYCCDEGGWWKYFPNKDEIEKDFVPRPAKPAAPEWDGYVDAGDNTEEWDGLAIEVVDGRISSITIPEGLENGVIRISKRKVEIL